MPLKFIQATCYCEDVVLFGDQLVTDMLVLFSYQIRLSCVSRITNDAN